MDCDDFSDEISFGQTWFITTTQLTAANLTGLTTANTGTLYYGSDSGSVNYGANNTIGSGSGDQSIDDSSLTLTQETKYVAAAEIAIELLSATPGSAAQADESVAIWDIFQPGSGVSVYITDAVETVMNQAISNAETDGIGALGGYSATVYTPTGCTSPVGTCAGGPNAGANPPQEFLYVTQVPEPSTWAFLGFDFVGAGIVGLYFLRRKSAVRP